MTKFLLFVQHGWADTSEGMAHCAKLLGVEEAIAPNLGWWRTWWRMAPLIDKVEAVAKQQLLLHPDRPWRIIGHSMGGLIWLELLHRFPQWHDRVESLVLLGSPVGGAELGQILDPFQWAIGGDLAVNRRALAEAIAQKIPTLSLSGDLGDGSDGVVTIGATQFNYAQCQTFPQIFHPDLRFDHRIIEAIQTFWRSPTIMQPSDGLQQKLIDYLRAIPGIMDGTYRDFRRAKLFLQFQEGLILKQWRNPIGFHHIYLGNNQEQCFYSGYVNWSNYNSFHRSIVAIPYRFSTYLSAEK